MWVCGGVRGNQVWSRIELGWGWGLGSVLGLGQIPGTGEPGGPPTMGVTQSRTRLKQLSSSSSKAKIKMEIGFWVCDGI